MTLFENYIFVALTFYLGFLIVKKHLGLGYLVNAALVFLTTSGLLLQAGGAVGIVWKYQGIVISQILVLAIILVFNSTNSEVRTSSRSFFGSPYPLMSFFAILLLVFSRLDAVNQQQFALSNISMLLPEDNAKWLNIVSEIVSNQRVDINHNSGVVVTYLASIYSYFTVIGTAFGWAANEITVVVNVVVLAGLFLIALAPLALCALGIWGPNRSRGSLVLSGLASLFMISAEVRCWLYGHLTAQLLIFFGVTFVSGSLHLGGWKGGPIHQRDLLIILIGFSNIWLPVQYFSVLFGLRLIYKRFWADNSASRIQKARCGFCVFSHLSDQCQQVGMLLCTWLEKNINSVIFSRLQAVWIHTLPPIAQSS